MAEQYEAYVRHSLAHIERMVAQPYEQFTADLQVASAHYERLRGYMRREWER